MTLLKQQKPYLSFVLAAPMTAPVWIRISSLHKLILRLGYSK